MMCQYSFRRAYWILFLLGSNFMPCRVSEAAPVPKITAPKPKITTFRVTILKPTGDPVTAGSADNEFTFVAPGGIATIPVEAKIEPAKLVATFGDQIKWTFVSVPAGSVVTWNNPWPGEPTAGRGVTAVATLTGYPTTNAQFGLRTIKMEVIRNLKVLSTKTAKIELFFARDTVATGRSAPNWFFYWLNAIGGRANTDYGGASGIYGEAPGILRWSYGTGQDKTKVIIYDLAKTDDAGDACSAHGAKRTTGIDTFEDTVVHENHHTVQVANADAVVGVVPGGPWRFGWAWRQGGNHNHWRVGADGKPGIAGTDDDGNGTVDDLIFAGPGELGRGDDVNLSDTGDPTLNWPLAFGSLPPLCWAGGFAVEEPAYDAEPDSENARAAVDWADPGKQHRTLNDATD